MKTVFSQRFNKFRSIFIILCFISLTREGFSTEPTQSIAEVSNNLPKKLKIGFFLEHLTVRGTEVSVYDYADFNEKILGNESIIVFVNLHKAMFQSNPDCPPSVREYFKARFGKNFYECDTLEEMDQILIQEKVDMLHVMKAGDNDGKLSKVVKTAVHAVFPPLQPHGDAHASISEWLSSTYTSSNVPYVPYMVRLDETTETLHDELKIPHGAVVFGRHGGFTSFDIDFAIEAVIQTATTHKEWYFIFLNTSKFCDLPNVIFLPPTPDLAYKTKFINTCDAMIHARGLGESFGLSCGEFSIKNKPVITWSGLGNPGYQRCHIEILQNKGFYYDDKPRLLAIFSLIGENINLIRSSKWDAYSEKYNPDAVMKKFDEVFIRPIVTTPSTKGDGF